MTAEVETLYTLMVALAIGLLIGVERGWQERDSEEGQRIAGVRTHGFIALLGGVLGLVAERHGPLVLGLGFVAVTAVIGAIFLLKQRQQGEWGITTLIASLLVFALGALATAGAVLEAAATAIISVLLLSYKPQLHGLVRGLELDELRAGIKLLLISVVLLPILPDQDYGPWASLNPFRIWLMVVLIAAISFVGYFAIKIGGARRGILFTGLFGGIASSTAVTLHLSRLGKDSQAVSSIAACGILLASGMVYIRLMIIFAMLAPSMLTKIWPLMLLMASLTYLPLLLLWQGGAKKTLDSPTTLQNPLELRAALIFGALLTAVMLLSAVLRETFGDAGLMTLAAISGMADVDAMVLALVGMIDDDLTSRLFVLGTVITVASNSIVKGGLVVAIGGGKLGLRATWPLVLAGVGGVLAAWWWYW